MQALELLLTRSSNGKLTAPAPTGDQLNNIIQAGLRAPDHANLSPYQFLVVTGNGLNKLGEIYHQAAVEENMDEKTLNRAKELPLRAPMVIVAICKYKPHPKVPRVEQVATTACAVQNMQMAALTQGFNGMWRTGSFAHSNSVKQQLALSDDDEIVGFLYVGTPSGDNPIRKTKDCSAYVEYWD